MNSTAPWFARNYIKNQLHASRMNIVLGVMTFGGQTSEEAATAMLSTFAKMESDSGSAAAACRLDSARMYGGGETDKMLGRIFKGNPDLSNRFLTSCKSNPFMGESLSKESLTRQLDEELQFSGRKATEIFYLHGPDANTPISETLQAVQDNYEQGKFKEFGLSNFTAWETVYIHAFMASRGWVVPTVYQGMYNALARNVEIDLLPAIRRLGMRFYVYNPLAGGMLTGKYERGGHNLLEKGRFTTKTPWGRIYQVSGGEEEGEEEG